MKEQMEDELLLNFNKQVQLQENRELNISNQNILQTFNTNENDDEKYSQNSGQQTNQQTIKGLGLKQLNKVDDEQANIEINEEKEFISIVKQKLAQKAKFNSTQTSICHPDQNEINSLYFKNQLALFANEKWQKQSFQTFAFVNQSKSTGNIFLKEYQIQKQESMNGQQLQVAVKFLKYNHLIGEMQYLGGILQDVFLNVDQNKLLLHSILSKGESHYYFLKQQIDAQKPMQRLILKKADLGEQSDYSFLENKPQLNAFKVQQVDKFKIDLPEDLKCNLGDFTYCFMQNTSIIDNENKLSEDQFIKKQFLLVRNILKAKQNQVILIYRLEDTSKPILRIEDNINDDFDVCFYTKLNQNQWAFSLIGERFQYEINYDKRNGLNQVMQQNSQQIQKEIMILKNIQTRLKPSQIEVQNITIDAGILQQRDDLKNKTIVQTYFRCNTGEIRLIHPIQSTQGIAPGIGTQIQSNYDKIVEIIQKQNEDTEQANSIILYFNDKKKVENNKSTVQMILKFLQTFHNDKNINLYQQIFCFKDLILGIGAQKIDCYSLSQNQFQKSFDEKCNDLSENKTLLRKVLNNFDFRNQEKKHINQNNLSLQLNQHTSNQYLDNFYINKDKKNVFTTHSRGFVSDLEFIFNPQGLLIDLSQQDNQKSKFQILKLYGQDCRDLKLLKYHTSKSAALFFFLYRKQDYSSQQEVYFFVIANIQDLKLLISSKKSLIEHDQTSIYIPQNNGKKIIFEKKIFNKNVFSSEEESNSLNQIKVQFEMLRDLGDLSSNLFPFMIHDKSTKKQIETYFCVLNIEQMNEDKKINYQFTQTIDFDDYLLIFKINKLYQENQQIKEIGNNAGITQQRLNKSQMDCNCNLFCRSSDWQKGLFENKNNSISAKFSIGTNLMIGNIHLIEIQEFLVTIDLSRKQNNGNSSIQTIQLTHSIRSQEFQCGNNEISYENERLLPNIDDDGNIQNTLVLLNNAQTNLGIFQISENILLLKNSCTEELYNRLKERAGQNVFVTAKQNNQFFDGIFFDGVEIKGIDYKVTSQFIKHQEKINQLEFPNKQKPLEYFYENFQKYLQTEYIYSIFELENQQNQAQSISGKLVTQTINQLSFLDMPKNQIFICQTKFNEDIVLNQNFDNNESQFWLFYYQNLLLCTSLEDFRELFSGGQSQTINRYFQPRFVLDGQNICNIDALKNQQRFKQALTLEFNENEHFEFMQNSIIYQEADKNMGIANLQILKQVFDFNHYYNLQYDFLNYQSIIEKAMIEGKSNIRCQKLLTFIVDYVTNSYKHQSFNVLIAQDFPYLLQNKININSFFNVSINSNVQSNQDIEQQNNLELILNDSRLHQYEQLSEDQPFSVQKISVEGPCFSKDKIIDYLMQNEETESEQASDLVPVIHSFINFQNVIRKIKIDQILNKANNLMKNGNINDFFIATIICQNQQNQEFITSNTIEKIIRIQYQRVQPVIKNMLFAYLLGFVLPFVYLVFEINYLDQNCSESKKIRDYFRIPLQLIACLTQIIFFVFEFANIHFSGINEYLSDAWNIIDSSQFLIFFVHIFVRHYYELDKLQEFGSLRLTDSILQVTIVILMASKILQYIRYNDDYSYLVQMLSQVFVDIIPFLTVFVLYIFILSIISLIMGADFADDDYQYLPSFMRIIMSVFRTSIGDIQAYDYGAWKDKKTDETTLLEETGKDNKDFLRAQPYAITIIWFIWYFNIFFMVIILANFLISEVGVTFENVKNLGNVFLNREKANFNLLIFQIYAFFGVQDDLSIMVFTQKKDYFENIPQESQFLQMINLIQKNTQASLNNLKIEINTIIKNQLTQNQTKQSQEIENQIEDLKQNIQDIQKDVVQIGISQEKVVVELLKKLEKQREEDRKLLLKLSIQQNSLPLRGKDFIYGDSQSQEDLRKSSSKFELRDSQINIQSASKFQFKQRDPSIQ